jgi:hypothetical protein
VEEFDRANGNALHLLPLIIPYKFPWLIVSICVLIDTIWLNESFDRFMKQTESHSGVFPQECED